MSRRPAFRPRLEGIESRLAPSAAPSSTAFYYILPYIEQDNLSKQGTSSAPSAEYLGAEVKPDINLH
jgi:hypothetical protein